MKIALIFVIVFFAITVTITLFHLIKSFETMQEIKQQQEILSEMNNKKTEKNNK